jgi:hypothetical protein
MRITSVGYGELVSAGYPTFGNRRMYLEAELSKTDDPNKVLGELQRAVKESLRTGKPCITEADMPLFQTGDKPQAHE